MPGAIDAASRGGAEVFVRIGADSAAAELDAVVFPGLAGIVVKGASEAADVSKAARRLELTIPAGEFRSPEAAGLPVSADGTMFFPHVGVVEVAGKTLPEIRALLTSSLKGVLEPFSTDANYGLLRRAGFVDVMTIMKYLCFEGFLAIK
jgi:hypothetical protein